MAVGFDRGRLKAVYQVLRGKDLDTDEFSTERREKQFAKLKAAQECTLDLTRWHQFLTAIIGAGFRSAELVSSKNALLYAYAFYLIGRERFKLPEHELQRLIGRWFFFSSLTGRYTSSPETVMDGDLNRVKAQKNEAGFVATLQDIIANTLTNDFWTITLPTALDNSSARNPELFAFIAAQGRLHAPVLFSKKKISELLDPSLKTKRKALERHHLFPKAYLEKMGITDLKLVNQQANLALLEWPDNGDISDDPPKTYMQALHSRFTTQEWIAMHDLHALPMGWETLPYEEFLAERRNSMAGIIRRGFEALS